MNREIKFRIWDKQNKNWLKNSSSLHCYSNWAICPFTGNLVDYVGAIDGDHGDTFTASPAADYYLEGTKLVKEPRYVIQQYTGLKDSKGNDIYEGDILDCKYDDEKVIAEIKYSEEYAAFLCGENALWQGWLGKAEIIGNIFENPELIKNDE